MTIDIYEVDPDYINYLLPYEPRLFHNKQTHQLHERKFIGIVLVVNKVKYFAPLSSFKAKHEQMHEGLDFIKLKRYAVINLNNMFPIPDGQYKLVSIKNTMDTAYRSLLQSEYRLLKKLESRILRNAALVYKHKLDHGNATPLGKRCNDFLKLEQACLNYQK